jgi:hypothetical protein
MKIENDLQNNECYQTSRIVVQEQKSALSERFDEETTNVQVKVEEESLSAFEKEIL